jgi:NAD(P)-dependent dehydrogenase (short-subunit alcohol dehydrogenase family)
VRIDGISAAVTGGASGLGLATARRLTDGGARVTILDLESSDGPAVASQLGNNVEFAPADVTDPESLAAALDAADERGPLRAVIHCAGGGGAVRLVEKDGSPGSLETFQRVINLNLAGSFNVLRLAAVRMARTEPVAGERGVVVLTASVAAFEGQVGQIPYASSKAAVVGMTTVAARDLASKLIRVCTIAPGTFDTPMLARVPEQVRASLAKTVPHPGRLGRPEEYAALAAQIVENPMLNGETIRLDGAIRMAPR